MFTLTNPWLLWAFPILALPWIFRRRQEDRIKHLKFPLLQFLKESEQKERVNPLLQEWLLLAIRTILLALLLLALAGPKWISPEGVSSRFLSFLPIGQSFNANVIVLDESYSMGYNDGENNWWQTAAEATLQLDQELQGLSTQWVRWSRERLAGKSSERLIPITKNELRQLFNDPPANNGSSISELFPAIANSFEGSESFVLISDGQALPWQVLLDADLNPQDVPSMLVVDVGTDPVQNSWVEIDTLSSPPWGVAAWETIAGKVNYFGQSNQDASVTIIREKTGETIYSKALSLPASLDQPAPLPFVFSTRYHELTANRNQQEQNSLSFLVSLQPNDALPIDDEVLLEVPTIPQFPVAIAGFTESLNIVHKVLASAFTIAPSEQENQTAPPVRSWGPDQDSLENVDLLIIPKNRVPFWNIAYTTSVLEYVKSGGSMVVFTGARTDDEWNNFLQQLGWTWLDEESLPSSISESNGDSRSFAQNINVWGDGLLGQSLESWTSTAWQTWIPTQHGTIPGRVAEPLVAYEMGDQICDLIVERPLGDGNVWIVNTILDQTSDTILSPILPAFLWETAKSVARTDQALEIRLPEPKPESNLIRLTDEQKQFITNQYNIRFTTPDQLSNAIADLYGGTDLRMLLLLLVLALALFESWLSNKMASL